MLKRLLIVMACLLFVVGCATVGIQPKVVPEGCEDSLIYKYMPSPKVTDTLLQVAMYNVVVEAPQFAIPQSKRGKTRTDGAQIKTVRLPTTCPNCDAAISQEKIDWVGPLEAQCNYCGATVRAKLESM